MGVMWGETIEGVYKPSLVYRLFKPRDITGNEINGLCETVKRRPTPIYHWFGMLKIPFNRVWWLLPAWSMVKGNKDGYMDTCREYADKPNDPVTDKKVEKSPEEWVSEIKNHAIEKGVDLVGIKRMRDEWVFEGFEVKEKWIIVLGLQMDYEKLATVPEPDGVGAVMKTYADGDVWAWEISNWLRSQGWYAKGYCGPMASPINLIPVALAAGFGELGKHGSIISRDLGSNLRLAYILTDVPLVDENEEDDFGADSFCTSCQICTRACPPNAILPEKQMVRGVKKWYVDFDKCVPFFNDTGGCGICIAVCPWTRPDVRPKLLAKMLKKKAKRDELTA